MKTSTFLFKNLQKNQIRVSSLILLFVMIAFSSFGQPTSAMLDVSAPDKGVLIPRVSLTSNLDIVTVPSPETSLLVYNTNTAGTYPNNVSPNFYYWKGNAWRALGSPLAYSEFFALMPGDNSATIAAGAAINFPQDGLTDGVIVRSSSNQFKLPDVGTYLVDWQVSISEAAQLVITLNGVELPNTVVGRATGSSQLVGHTVINTTLTNSILTISNASGNPTALTVTTIAGGTHPVSANLMITRLQ